MEIHALSPNCEVSFAKREHCCFGISPFNSYFSEEKIRELAQWGLREFKSMHFFVPDIPAIYTLQAQGYTPERAEWKARRQSQYLKNKIRRALDSLSIATNEISEMILDWERLSANAAYVKLLAEVTERFETDDAFHASCLEASHWVLSQKFSDTSEVTDEALNLGVKYFLAELPLFAATAQIVGTESSVFCYHQRVNFLEAFYAEKLTYRPTFGQGFLVLQSPTVPLEMSRAPVREAAFSH